MRYPLKRQEDVLVRGQHHSKVAGKSRSTEYLRQLHTHEHPGHEEAEEDADEANEQQQEAIKFGNVWSVGAIQDDKA